MKLKVVSPRAAGPGMDCIVTLVPEVNPLSVVWYHKSREEAVA